jgi:hypothetical protein
MGAGATRLIPGTEKWGGYKEDCSLWDMFLSPSRTSEASTQVDFGGGDTLSGPKMDGLSQEASGLRKGNLAARCIVFYRGL